MTSCVLKYESVTDYSIVFTWVFKSYTSFCDGTIYESCNGSLTNEIEKHKKQINNDTNTQTVFL